MEKIFSEEDENKLRNLILLLTEISYKIDFAKEDKLSLQKDFVREFFLISEKIRKNIPIEVVEIFNSYFIINMDEELTFKRELNFIDTLCLYNLEIFRKGEFKRS